MATPKGRRPNIQPPAAKSEPAPSPYEAMRALYGATPLTNEESLNLPAEFPGAEPTVSPATAERRERELEEILEEVGTDSRIRVYHVIDGRPSFAGEMAVADFSLDTLLDAFGGGEKTLKIFQGKRHIETSKAWLDPNIPPRSPRQARIEAERRLAPGAGGGMGDVASFITAMAAAQSANAQAMNTMMMQSQQTTTGMINAMIQMLAANNGNKVDPLDMVTKVAEIMRPKETPSMLEAMSVFENGLKIGQTVAGGGGDGDGIMPVIGEGVKALGTLVEGIVAGKRAEAQRMYQPEPVPQLPAAPLPPPPPPPAASAPAHITTLNPTDTDVNDRLWVGHARRANLALMFQMARVMSPEAAADTILRNLPDAEFDDLMSDIFDMTAPGFGPRLAAYFPQVATVPPEWVGEVIRLIIESTEDGDGDDTDAAGNETGNGGSGGGAGGGAGSG
jgi:hypothetical protein